MRDVCDSVNRASHFRCMLIPVLRFFLFRFNQARGFLGHETMKRHGMTSNNKQFTNRLSRTGWTSRFRLGTQFKAFASYRSRKSRTMLISKVAMRTTYVSFSLRDWKINQGNRQRLRIDISRRFFFSILNSDSTHYTSRAIDFIPIVSRSSSRIDRIQNISLQWQNLCSTYFSIHLFL